MSTLPRIVTCAVLALSLAVPGALAQGKGHGKGSSAAKSGKSKGHGKSEGSESSEASDRERVSVARTRHADDGSTSAWSERKRARLAEDGRAFSKHDEDAIREWFRDGDATGLPPGLAKRDTLPPGLERQLERNGTLPPGLENHLHSLPDDFDSRLTPTRDGVRRAVVGSDVILLETRTSRILDVLRGAADRRER